RLGDVLPEHPSRRGRGPRRVRVPVGRGGEALGDGPPRGRHEPHGHGSSFGSARWAVDGCGSRRTRGFDGAPGSTGTVGESWPSARIPAAGRGRGGAARAGPGGRRGRGAAGPAPAPGGEVSGRLAGEAGGGAAAATAGPGRPAAGAPPRERVLVHAAGDLVVAAECEYR